VLALCLDELDAADLGRIAVPRPSCADHRDPPGGTT
jgi:hypothetical protein